MSVRRRILALVLASTVAACGAKGDAYKQSLESKRTYSILQDVELDLRTAPKKPFIYKAHALNSDVDVIALPLQNRAGYAAFTAQADDGRVLSVPEDGPVAVDLETLREILRKRLVSDATAAELVRRSA